MNMCLWINVPFIIAPECTDFVLVNILWVGSFSGPEQVQGNGRTYLNYRVLVFQS